MAPRLRHESGTGIHQAYPLTDSPGGFQHRKLAKNQLDRSMPKLAISAY